jgi:hypothetical protein
MLKDNDIVLEQKRLFSRDVDVKIWIRLIEIIDGYSGQGLNGR